MDVIGVGGIDYDDRIGNIENKKPK